MNPAPSKRLLKREQTLLRNAVESATVKVGAVMQRLQHAQREESEATPELTDVRAMYAALADVRDRFLHLWPEDSPESSPGDLEERAKAALKDGNNEAAADLFRRAADACLGRGRAQRYRHAAALAERGRATLLDDNTVVDDRGEWVT